MSSETYSTRKPVGATSGNGRSFIMSVARGFASAGAFIAGTIEPPQMPNGSINADWKAVGSDLNAAIRKHG